MPIMAPHFTVPADCSASIFPHMHIRLDNVSFQYAERPVLDGVSFDVRRGDFLSILGPNGCGKSTLLRLMTGILKPQQGALFLDDRPLSGFHRKDLARLIGYVPQETAWLFPFTVMEVVLMGRTPYLHAWGFEAERDLEIARYALQQTDVLHLENKPITAISGGERQRVLIARALAQEPALLLLDEPNAHLDLYHQIEVFRILQRQREQQGTTVVSVSHDLNLAAAFSSTLVLMTERSPGTGNHVAACGPPAEVLTESSIQQVFHADVQVDRMKGSDTVRVSFDRTFTARASG